MNEDPTSLELRLLTLLHQARDEQDENARAELNTLLRENAEARREIPRLLVDEQALVSELRAEGIVGLMATPVAAAPAAQRTHGPSGWFAWFSRRPLTAAAAGLAIGSFCASVVFAYVAPSLGKVVSLLDESFESGPAPLVTGMPVEPGRWSGDFTEIVGKQQGVKPESGGKMLRFLKADYEGKPNAQGSRVADVYRLIDLRPYRQEFADGSAVVQLSAGFNAFEYPSSETYIGTITIHAFDAESVTNGSLRTRSTRDDTSLAVASTGGTKLDRNPESWQRLISDLRVPANTDFLFIHILIPAGRGTREKAGFGGHYIDDVRLTLRRSP